MKSEKPLDRTALAMFITSMIIFGTIGPVRRMIPLSSAMIVFFRGLIGSLFLSGFAWITGSRGRALRDGRTNGLLVLNGAFLGLNWILLFEAYRFTTIANATLAYYTAPVIVLLLSPLVLREKLTGRSILCALTACLGMVLVSGVLSSKGAGRGDLQGIACGLAAACFYAMVVLTNKRIPMEDAFQRTIVQLASAALVLVPYLLLNGEGASLSMSALQWAILLGAGIVHTGIAYVLYFGSMTRLPGQTVSMLSYIDPVVAMLISAFLLKEGMSAGALMGAALIIGSAVISGL